MSVKSTLQPSFLVQGVLRIPLFWWTLRSATSSFHRAWLFCSLEPLPRFGGFDPPSCDTTLGYKLSFGGIPFVLMQTRDLSEVPHDPKTIFKQGIVWFNGCELYLREYFKGKKSDHSVANTRNYYRILQVFFTNLSWSFLPIFWSITCLLTFNTCPFDWSLAIGLWLGFR